MYPNAVCSKFYGLSKTHKKDTPQAIVSHRDSVTDDVAKELASILHPLVGRSTYHIQNKQNFAESIKDTKLQLGESITSYDVTTSFTSVPAGKTHNKLVQDQELSLRIKLTIRHAIEFLDFCLQSTQFKCMDYTELETFTKYDLFDIWQPAGRAGLMGLIDPTCPGSPCISSSPVDPIGPGTTAALDGPVGYPMGGLTGPNPPGGLTGAINHVD